VVGGGFKVEDRFLDVRGKLGEVDDLRYAGTGDAGGAGNLGLVFDLAGILAGMRLANKSDVAALELYCRAYGDWRDACEKVAKLGQVLFTKKNGELSFTPTPSICLRSFRPLQSGSKGR
jgi:hypothetical protein